MRGDADRVTVCWETAGDKVRRINFRIRKEKESERIAAIRTGVTQLYHQLIRPELSALESEAALPGILGNVGPVQNDFASLAGDHRIESLLKVPIAESMSDDR